jgi:hypothetical protein
MSASAYPKTLDSDQVSACAYQQILELGPSVLTAQTLKHLARVHVTASASPQILDRHMCLTACTMKY